MKTTTKNVIKTSEFSSTSRTYKAIVPEFDRVLTMFLTQKYVDGDFVIQLDSWRIAAFSFLPVFNLMPSVVYGVICQLTFHGGGMLRCLQEGLQHYTMFPSSIHPLRVGEDVNFQVNSDKMVNCKR